MTRADKLFSPFPFQRSRGALEVYDLKIKDVVTDPHAADLSTVYVCVRTPLFDGHDHASQAYANGCRCFVAARGLLLPEDAAVYITEDPEAHLGELAARCFGYPARSLTVIGITGTHGKTSVAYTLATVLENAGRKVALLTSDGTEIDGAFSASGAVAPNAADIERMLYAARRKGAELAIVEFSPYMLMHKAEISIPFASVLLTTPIKPSCGEVHNDQLSANEKSMLKLLSCDAPLLFLPEGTVYNGGKGRVLSYGGAGDIACHDVRPERRNQRLGTAFSITYKEETAPAFYPVVGDFAAHNATAAAALALAVGIPLGDVAASLSHAQPTGRLECIFAQGGAHVFVDTAYEARELHRALRILRTVTAGKLSVLLGSVGGRAVARRAPLGVAASLCADFVYFTADDPDGENPLDIISDMTREIKDPSRYLTIASRQEAILRACADLRAGDTLLILTKARDNTQLFCGVKRKFSDRDIVINAVQRS